MGQIGEALFGDGGASAAGNAAMAQQNEAKRQWDYTEQPTVQAMLNFDSAIKSQEKNLARQEQMIAQIDPTVIEASQQALRLMRGEDASITAPLKRQRDLQRQKLLNSLREQLGPGAETSTAGIQALTRFDAETDQLFAGAQQQAISQLGQTAGQFNAVRPNMLQESLGLGQLGAGRANLAYDRIKGAGQGMLQTAGAEYTADVIRGQNRASFGRSMLGLAGTLGAGYLSGGTSLAAGAASGAAQGLQTGAQQGYNFGSQGSYLGSNLNFGSNK